MSIPVSPALKALTTVVVLLLCLGGCAREMPRSVSHFIEDETGREYKLEACNADPGMNRTDEECTNARIAAERLAVIREKEKRVTAEKSFQQRIEAMRARERDLQRQLEEQKKRAEEEMAAEANRFTTAFPVDPDPAADQLPAKEPTPTADTNAAPLPVEGG